MAWSEAGEISSHLAAAVLLHLADQLMVRSQSATHCYVPMAECMAAIIDNIIGKLQAKRLIWCFLLYICNTECDKGHQD